MAVSLYKNNLEMSPILTWGITICDCQSENPPSALASISRNTILKIQLKITSLALVMETFTEHNST